MTAQCSHKGGLFFLTGTRQAELRNFMPTFAAKSEKTYNTCFWSVWKPFPISRSWNGVRYYDSTTRTRKSLTFEPVHFV